MSVALARALSFHVMPPPTTTTQEASSPGPAEQARELYTEVLSDSEHIEFNYPHEDRGPDTGTPGPKSGVLAKKSGDVL